MNAYDPRHFRFERRVTESPVLECYEPESRLRWIVPIIIGALTIIALVVPA